MDLDKIIVLIVSLAGILFTYWFFLQRPDNLVKASGGEVDISVDGGYNPDVISIPFGTITKLNFLRKDPSSCLEEVVISEFKTRKFLPLNQKVTIEVSPKKKGEFGFSCGMGMFHGKLIIN